jgi:hypothetical protein
MQSTQIITYGSILVQIVLTHESPNDELIMFLAASGQQVL